MALNSRRPRHSAVKTDIFIPYICAYLFPKQPSSHSSVTGAVMLSLLSGSLQRTSLVPSSICHMSLLISFLLRADLEQRLITEGIHGCTVRSLGERQRKRWRERGGGGYVSYDAANQWNHSCYCRATIHSRSNHAAPVKVAMWLLGYNVGSCSICRDDVTVIKMKTPPWHQWV